MIEKFYAPTAAGQIHGRRIAGEGPPVVLLHRTPISAQGFDRVMGFLAHHGQPSVAFDMPGFGESFRPEGSPRAADYAGWILEAIDALGLDRFHLAAHHTGTHFAAEIAARVPHRVISLILSGVMFADAETRARARREIPPAPPIEADGRHFAETVTLMRSLFIDPNPDPGLVHAETMGALVSGQARDLAFDAIFEQDFPAVIGEVLDAGIVPVRIVQAMDDPLTLSGHLTRFRQAHPRVPVTLTGPAFLALPERQSGAFGRALIAATGKPGKMTNRRYHLKNQGDRFDLIRADDEIPAPGRGEVLVRVRAASLNRRDLGVRDLSYPVNGADDFTPLSDAAGEVVAVGEAVTAWAPGDRVMSAFFQNFPEGRPNLAAALSSLGAGGPGVLADHVVLAEGGIVAMPEGWSFEDAACLTCAGVTAWSALNTLGGLRAGDDVLVIGTGGVALFAVQIAAASGARAIVVSSSDDKIDRAKALGAVAGINYRGTPDWAAEVRRLTRGAGVHHVLELGGAGTLRRSLDALGLGGHLALIGALDGFGGDIPVPPLIFGAQRISAVMVGSRADHEALARFMAARGLRPVVDRIFPFEAAQAAYRHVETGAFGKVVIQVAPR